MAIRATSVTFPDQQKILDYINAHPGRPIIDGLPPDFQDVNIIAEAFANKVMKREEIEKNIKTALMADKKMIDLKISVQKLVECLAKFEERDPLLEWRTEGVTWIDEKALLALQAIYSSFLNDLVNKAAFIPPKEGESNWTRVVNQL